MAFELRDKTEDYVQFLKDGTGIRYTGEIYKRSQYMYFNEP